MMHVPTCDKLRDEFLELYRKDFEITGGGLMETFLGMEVEQPCNVIRLHPSLDSYIQEVLTEFKPYIKEAFRPKKVLMSPGLVLNHEDCPMGNSYPLRSTSGNLCLPVVKYYRSFIAKLQFVASWIRF